MGKHTSRIFNPTELKKLYVPPSDSSGEDNGQVTIIGGSELFHGAPLLAITSASRIVDMVFFASPYKPMKDIADKIKSELLSFIWVPWNDVENYIEKSDACLIGSGLMRFSSEKDRFKRMLDTNGRRTKHITEYLLKEFPYKKWVIDAGSLQTMKAEWIPKDAIITPNKKEFQMLFDIHFASFNLNEIEKAVEIVARRHRCIVVLKGPTTFVSNGEETVRVEGGNPGLTKGGTGDVLAGITVALLAKNDPMLAACSASYVIKKAADELYKEVGVNYNADEVARKIPEVLWHFIRKDN